MQDKFFDIATKKAKEFGVKKLYLFGSSLDDSEIPRDIDLAAIGLKENMLLRFAGELENELLVNVDVIDLENESSFVEYIKTKTKLIYETG